MKLLQGVAQDELLIRNPLHPPLPSHPDFVGVGAGRVSVLSVYCSFQASAEIRVAHVAWAHKSETHTPQAPGTFHAGERIHGGVGTLYAN